MLQRFLLLRERQRHASQRLATHGNDVRLVIELRENARVATGLQILGVVDLRDGGGTRGDVALHALEKGRDDRGRVAFVVVDSGFVAEADPFLRGDPLLGETGWKGTRFLRRCRKRTLVHHHLLVTLPKQTTHPTLRGKPSVLLPRLPPVFVSGRHREARLSRLYPHRPNRRWLLEHAFVSTLRRVISNPRKRTRFSARWRV